MTSQLDYIIARQRAEDLARVAKRARPATDADASRPRHRRKRPIRPLASLGRLVVQPDDPGLRGQHPKPAGAHRYAARASTASLAPAITLRFGTPDDVAAVSRLAALDCAEVPAEPVLVAEADGVLRAAMSLSDDEVIADPFQPTEQIVLLLRERASQLRGDPARRHRAEPRTVDAARPAWR